MFFIVDLMEDVLTGRTREILRNIESNPVCGCNPSMGSYVTLWYDGLGTIYGSGKNVPKIEGVAEELICGVFRVDSKGPLEELAFVDDANKVADDIVLKQIAEFRREL